MAKREWSLVAFSSGINAQEDKKKESKSPQRRSSVGKEGEWDAYNGGYAEHHTYIDEYVEKQNGKYTIAEDAAKRGRLSL